MNWIKKHRSLVLGLLIVIGGLLVLAVYERQQVLTNTTESKLENPPRTEEVFSSSFYYDQLNDREKADFEQLAGLMESKQGGVVTLEEPLNGKEYTRVCNALEYDQADYFYALVDVPMTGDNQYVLYDSDKQLTSIEEKSIEKCILFLYCAEGIDEKGNYDEQGYVKNIDQMAKDLAVNNQERLDEIEEIRQSTEEVLSQVVADIPKEYGQKETIDYFMGWMKKNLLFDLQEYENLSNVTTMQGLFKECYFRSHESCVVQKKALTAGFNKVLMNLCNRAGMESHIVFGIWNREETGYVLTSVQIGDTAVYVDAAGLYAQSLAEQKYLREEEAAKHMVFAEYFDWKMEQ